MNLFSLQYCIMTPEIVLPSGNQPKESSEINLGMYAPLLGGMFETAGTMLINVNRIRKQLPSGERIYTYASPILRYKDNRAAKVRRFKDIFGGSFRPDGRYNSYQWTVLGDDAVELAIAMEPFAPSRSEVINAFRNWQNEGDHDERLSIAGEVKGEAKQIQPKEVYAALLENDAFLAGIFEARGFLTTGRDGKRILAINTTNANLRKAIQEEFGGALTTKKSKSVSLQIYSEQEIGRIISVISPRLITPLEEYTSRATAIK